METGILRGILGLDRQTDDYYEEEPCPACGNPMSYCECDCPQCGRPNFACTCPPPPVCCPKCGQEMKWTEGAGYPGEYFVQIECPTCGYWETENTQENEGLCPVCGQSLPVRDADYSGVSYGKCRNCCEVWWDKEGILWGDGSPRSWPKSA
jgi:hypothetical protein